MKKSFMVALAVMASGVSGQQVRANDSAFSGVGGTMKPMKGQHSSVRMESEKIVINAYENHYDTTVDFIFHNTGKKNIATMGFPEGNYGDTDAYTKTMFRYFKTSVDGVPTKVKRTNPKRGEGGPEDMDAWWVKVVPFNAGQRRRVRVQYSSPYGGTASFGLNNAISYNFTGKNWKGDVARSDLEIHLRAPGRWLVLPMWSDGENDNLHALTGVQHSGTVLRRTWRNWEAQGYLMVGLVPSRAGFLLTKESFSSDSLPARTLKSAFEISVPGTAKKRGESSEFSGFPPAGFVQNGVSFIALDQLQSALFSATEEKFGNNDSANKIMLRWSAPTKTRTLIAGKNTLSWREGVKSMTVNGKAQTLAAAPFVVNNTLYVPAVAAAKVLGGRVETNSAKRWIDFMAVSVS